MTNAICPRALFAMAFVSLSILPSVAVGLTNESEATPPKPKGNPAYWITPQDYTKGARERRSEGITAFRLTIDATGKIVNCTVTSSSGDPELDARSCQALLARAQFKPAKNAQGEAVEAVWESKVTWSLPGSTL